MNCCKCGCTCLSTRYLYESGTAIIESLGMSTHLGIAVSYSTSFLSRRLAPPTVFNYKTLFLVLAVFMGIATAFCALEYGTNSNIPLVLFGSLGILLVLAVFSPAYSDNGLRRLDNWSRSGYCSECNVISYPEN